MSESESLTHEQLEFERALKALQPRSEHQRVADLLYRAGFEAAQLQSHRQLLRWKISTFVTTACALIALVAIDWSSPVTTGVSPVVSNRNTPESTPPETTPPQREIEQVAPDTNSIATTTVKQPELAPEPRRTIFGQLWQGYFTVSIDESDNYLGIRNRVLEEGIDALPQSESSDSGATSEPLVSSPKSRRELLRAWDTQI